MKKSLRKCGGYSLAEVIVALGVVSIFAVGAFGTMYTTSAIQQSSIETVTANHILQHEIEHVRSMRWEEVEALVLLDEIPVDPNYQDVYGDEFYRFSRSITDDVEDMRTFTISVSWTSHTGRERSMSSSAILYVKDGLSDSYYKVYD